MGIMEQQVILPPRKGSVTPAVLAVSRASCIVERTTWKGMGFSFMEELLTDSTKSLSLPSMMAMSRALSESRVKNVSRISESRSPHSCAVRWELERRSTTVSCNLWTSMERLPSAWMPESAPTAGYGESPPKEVAFSSSTGDGSTANARSILSSAWSQVNSSIPAACSTGIPNASARLAPSNPKWTFVASSQLRIAMTSASPNAKRRLSAGASSSASILVTSKREFVRRRICRKLSASRFDSRMDRSVTA